MSLKDFRISEYMSEIGKRGGAKSRRALTKNEAERLRQLGLQARRMNSLARLRRDLKRLTDMPAIDRAQYERERDYNRAVTLRARRQREIERKIRCLESGAPLSRWTEF